MDAEEYLRDLPDDAGQALIKIDDRFRASLEGATESTYGPLRELQLTLCVEWAKQHNLDLPTNKIEQITDIAVAHVELEKAIDQLRRVVNRLEISSLVKEVKERRTTNPYGVTKLETEEKTKIHKHLDAIREIVDGSNLDSRKKTAILGRLGKLSVEVDRDGTRTDAFFGLFPDIGLALGGLAENAEPAVREFKAVLRIIYRSQARTEKIELPAPGDEPLLADLALEED